MEFFGESLREQLSEGYKALFNLNIGESKKCRQGRRDRPWCGGKAMVWYEQKNPCQLRCQQGFLIEKERVLFTSPTPGEPGVES